MAQRYHCRSNDESIDPYASFQNDMANLFSLINSDNTISAYLDDECVIGRLRLEKDNFSVNVILPLLALNGLEITSLRDCVDRANEGKLTLSPQSLLMICELYHTLHPKHPIIVAASNISGYSTYPLQGQHPQETAENLSRVKSILENLVPWLQCLFLQVTCCEEKFLNVADLISSTLMELDQLVTTATGSVRSDVDELLRLVHEVIDCIIHLHKALDDRPVKQRRFAKMVFRGFYPCLRPQRWRGVREAQLSKNLFQVLFSDALEQWVRPVLETYANPCRPSPCSSIGREMHLPVVDYLPFYVRHVYGYSHPSSFSADHRSSATNCVTLEKLHKTIGPPNFVLSTHDGSTTFKVHDWILAARWPVYFTDLIRSGTAECSDRIISLSDEITSEMLIAMVQSFYHPHIYPPFIASNLFTLELMKQYRLDETKFPALLPIVPREEEDHDNAISTAPMIGYADVQIQQGGHVAPLNRLQQFNPNNNLHPLNGLPMNLIAAFNAFGNFANNINHHCVNSTSIFQLIKSVLGDRLITPPITSVGSFLDVCNIGVASAMAYSFVHHPSYYLPRFLTLSLVFSGILGFGTTSLLIRLIKRFKRVK